MLGLAVGLPLVPPLLLRGAVLRWLVARETASLCGAIRVEGGSLGWLVVPDLLLGRPFAVDLRGLRVAGPDGGEVLAAEHLSADVDVARNPWRIVVARALVSRGRWRLSVDDTNGGFLGVFRAVPAGATRAACLAPAPRRRGPRPPPSTGASLVVRDARLEEIDVELDFPVWGLALPRVRAIGSLALGTPGGEGFTFDVRDATAPGGRLRAGPGGAHATVATTTALFDDVLISHVGVSPAEPSDLVLAVAHADTGRSRLAGKAVFENVFARHGRRGERNPPGLALDARWERLTDAAARLEAPWLPREALGEILDGTMTARVRGPFRALTGALSIEGPRAGIEATVERGERATLDVRASGLALGPFLADSLEPLLAGRVTGRLRAALELGAGLAAVDLEIPAADVTLMRAAKAPEPRRLVFRVGPRAPGTHAARADDDTLELGLTSARLFQRTLQLEGLSAHWGDLSARGALALSLPPPVEGAPAPPGRVDASVTLAVASLARWVRPETASGQLLARATVSGPLDHLRARLSFAPSTKATILGERFRAPAPVTATLDDGRSLTLAGLVLTRVGGGRLEARGRAVRAGPLSGELRLTAYPLGALPGLTTVALPAALGPGRDTSLGDALGGTLDAALTVTGSSSRPAFSGTLALAGVSLSGRRLGDGHLKARARGLTVALEGTLGPALALDVGATLRPDGVTADGNLALVHFALGPWLPPALADLDVAITGHARVAVTPRRPLRTQLDVRAVGAGGDLALRGSTSGDEAEAAARGRVELGGLRALWGSVLAAADGAVDVDLATAPRAPLTGTIVVARALALRPNGWPLALGVAEGSRLAVDGTRVHLPGVTLTAPGARVALAGDVKVDLAAPERSDLALTATGRLDAGTLARQARLPWLSSAAGTIAVDARATGQAQAPVATGTARLDALELRPRSATWPALKLDGLIEASDHRLLTRGLHVEAVGDAVAQGAVVVGAADAPAVVDIASAWPLRVRAVDVPLSAHGLRVGNARSAFAIGALDLRLRLTGDPARELVLAGDVGVARARVDPFIHKKTASGPARPWFEALPPRLTLDLTVHGPNDALVVAVPVLPDLDLGFDCRVSGNARGGSISGRLRGRGLYSRLLLSMFGPAGARQCRVLKE
ncbi:MAG TPA: hypothetical protein VMT47_15295 [Polyangia bacterium]|nr:hypothetical protein [Polyangia bacterium]